jgi:nucleotide-binding universal stress UspA family protein
MALSDKFRIRRILYALDAATDASDSLEAAAEIAERLDAELIGLFVEDVNLLRSAALPFVREINLGLGGWREFSPANVERELRGRAARAQLQLEESARRRRLTFSFRVARGDVGREVAAAAEEVDLVILEGMTRPMGSSIRISSSARTAAQQNIRTVLVLRKGHLNARQFMVVYEGTEQSDKALSIAARLAETAGASLRVLIIAADSQSAAAYQERARESIAHLGVGAAFEILGEPTLIDVCQFARRARDAVLVIGADSALAGGASADELIDRIACPLIYVR